MLRLFMVGLALGAILAGVGFFFLSELSTHIVFESDEAKTLGLQFEPAPKVALRPLTYGEIADRLGISSQEKLKEESQIFAEKITAGYVPSDWSTKCYQEHSESLCRIIEDYFEKQAGIFPAPKTSSKKPLIISQQKMPSLQKEDFNLLLSRIPEWPLSKMKSFAESALKTSECPRSFSLALSQKMEIHLDKKAELLPEILKLMNHGVECLGKNEAWSELMFMRLGLWKYYQKDFPGALIAFDRALQALDKKEEYRVLYWKYRIYQEQNKTEDIQRLTQTFQERFPLSWYTVITLVPQNWDPLKKFLDSPVYSDEYSSGDDYVNRRQLWLEALFELEGAPYAVKKYGEYVVRTVDKDCKPGFIQYLARSLDRNGYHRLQILLLNRMYYWDANAVTRETVRLMFPKPFFEELDRHSPQLDTALLLGLARQESGFDPAAQSSADARGLLQILPSTAKGIHKKIDKDALYNYAQNIEIGARYVLKLIQGFDDSVEKALASYNAGQGTLRKWERRYGFIEDPQLFLDIMPFRETRDYVPSVLRNAYWYHRLFPELSNAISQNMVKTSSVLKASLYMDPNNKNLELRFKPHSEKLSEGQNLQPASQK